MTKGNVQVKNIIVGAAALYVSVKNSADNPTDFWGTALGQTIVAIPTLTPSAPAGPVFDTDTTNWRGVGFTEGGVNVSYEPTFGEVPVDQLLDAAVLFKSALKVVVKTVLAEAILTNLIVAWGQQDSSVAPGTGPDALDSELGIAGGQLGDAPVERSVVFIGPAPRTAGTKRERLYHLRRSLNVTTSAHDLKKDAATTVPVELRLLQDPYYSGKEYGIIRDRNVVAA